MMKRLLVISILFAFILTSSGCTGVTINIGGSASETAATTKPTEVNNEFTDDIEEIKHDIEKERYILASDAAEELLKEKGLTQAQRAQVADLLGQAIVGKEEKYKPTAKPSSSGSGKAMATKEEAVEIARKFLGIAADAKYTYDIEIMQEYYYVHFEVDYGGEEPDEIGCKVDALGFYAYDPAG